MKLLDCNPTALWLGCGALGVIGAIVISMNVPEVSMKPAMQINKE
jgi:hypothetical protein